ncbi:molybdopterin-dependent oxidoreductase [Ponticoccus sp. SC2-23]|uniref:molybdopterin-dependent oxidoreductase n=1 Tax=Alexandriicola marinus TaxID=2081710 RepID=UPI000FD7E870|nr:molybdopterin cofactor-binding domain-containing protein [Alexandriicola marinus]MBM1222319.1 molybdopterin-dependent oxidoreductase [Ponticoccus sp. SC6-9]MBM1224432.1 molybdopterin-dependent oxidoreductase [Ponticoccus sp. SC6-15]MBM1229788.1 molybdopterin-dependent oxidoreductase [Ponticoccus sp. SC6-38]MBM1233398.1 molybdopterin-dependent oxidoreductase [Ponticoccus sp. SC6-45]MBM1236652.1 molybdopterin-dependent oxidoreductase [Ponticoccus sp. SC6-49]MBM1244696.1 molybdopterin-depende
MKDGTAPVTLRVAGREHAITSAPGRRLSEVLREELGLRSVKIGCDAGDCGACTILVDGVQHCACLMPVAQAAGAEIETLETLDDPLVAQLKASFLDHGAAQCGICTPGVMMAAVELLRETPAPSEAQVHEALGGVLCRCTGYRKIIEAICALDTPAVETRPEAGQAVGAPVRRVDGRAKVDGTEVYGADHVPLGTLLVRAVRSPHFHADFELGDVSTWGARRDVIVLTARDVPGENRFGTIPGLEDQPAIAEARVRYLGEPVALVVGAPDVVEPLDLGTFPVEWHPLGHSLTEAEGAADDAPQLHDHRPGNTLIRGRVISGRPEEALAGSRHVARGRFETSYVEHAYIEPEAGIAWLDDDTLVIQACTQAPVLDRDETAKVLGLPKDKVRIIPAASGGGFGAKLDLSVQPLIGLATLATGQPCRMVWSRSESMLASTKRHPGTMEAEIGCGADGRITGMTFHGDFNTGAYASWGPTVAMRVPVHASGPYRTANFRATARAVHSNGPSSGAFRGFGVPQAAIAQESLYDDLARAAGIDRLAFRRLNALRDGDRTTCGQELHGVGLGACLDALAEHWHRATHEAAEFNAGATGALRRGIGIASCWYGCGNTGLPNPSTIRIGITPAGQVMLHQGATDIGQGANTVITQIAADAAGLPLDALTLVGPDTALTPDCGKTSASRQTYVTGKAAEAAGRALRAEIMRRTNLPDCDAIEPVEGGLRVRHGAQVQDVALSGTQTDELGYAIRVEETYDPPTTALDADGQGTPYAVYGYGAQIAEVEVDLDLGTTRVLHMIAAHDVGRAINPQLCVGQIEGGIAQGLGLALMEEFLPGRTENLHDYLIPTIGDMPKVTSILIETPDPEGPMGAKGLGEHVLIPTAPAILNAIRDATGVAALNKVPVLPHRLRAAIRGHA